MGVRIHHIVTGELESSLPVSLLNSGAHPDVPHERRLPFGFRDDIVRRDGSVHAGVMVPVPVWLIEGTEETILIDTGLGDIDEVSAMQSRYGVDFVASRTRDQDLVAGLARHGVRPDDVDVVVLTHLHFDHIGNNELFPNARFVVQRDELPQAQHPPHFCMFYYPEYAYKIDAVRDRLLVIDGDHALDPAVRLVKIGGHTPGCMVVMVTTDVGVVCLTSDVMYNYRNLELNWPMGSFWNLPELMAGYDRLHEEADIIIPEHDWQFLEEHPSGTVG
ncbi:N-acyl homoserine lactonase family protein [Streptomyces radicis]|uniref:N-acyl homoserine lactonase family protein n=1 Tax=Streptomyces radicis TaxID=1750517 RepID=A0A3A9WC27_9ACTN|nr:N-acyl homoserine lactonase family protein [Streptomyces radicis]RKN03577.1 N-acyl homoserine lactonase family protein [Streptomyces radicis]RKN13438.1 N-acyl homoserine lactonase family protein [Streptomyces radicis]